VRAFVRLVNAGNAGRPATSFLHAPVEPIKLPRRGKELPLNHVRFRISAGVGRLPPDLFCRRWSGFSPHILLAARPFDAKLPAVGYQTNSSPKASGRN
jgi:hypothetical protein